MPRRHCRGAQIAPLNASTSALTKDLLFAQLVGSATAANYRNVARQLYAATKTPVLELDTCHASKTLSAASATLPFRQRIGYNSF